VIELLSSSAFGAALVFGFRHGFDWDHLAALTDLTGSQTSSRRSMWLATLYALGHAAMVVVLGCAAILFTEQVPGAVDAAMERVVGASLIALGLWMLWTAVRTGGAPPLRSRWMLLIEGVRRILRRRASVDVPVVIEHAHAHDHAGPMHAHTHSHIDTDGGEHGGVRDVVVQHRHVHQHVAVVPHDPFMRYGGWSSFGVGLLHGVGAETPTQVVVFAAAANASGRPASLGLLLCFVVGLLVSNSLVAAASTFGFTRVVGNRLVTATLAAVTVTFSLCVGTLLLLGEGAVLPPMLGG
jgi:high-affinity nickel-transport protein